MSMDLELPVGIGGSVGWMDDGTWRTGEFDPLDKSRKSLYLGGRWRFRKTTYIELQYQRVDTESRLTVDKGQQQELIPLEGYTNLYSVYFRASF